MKVVKPIKLGSSRNTETFHKRSTVLGAHMAEFTEHFKMEKPPELRVDSVKYATPSISPRTASKERRKTQEKIMVCKDLQALLKKPQTVEVDLARMT